MLPPNIKALILDMDGVIWKSDAPIGDLSAIFKSIEARRLKYVFATNNGTKTPEQYAEKLAEFGVNVEPWQVITSSLAVSYMLSQKFPSGTKIFMIGEDGVHQALQEKGFQVLGLENAQDAQIVVMGIDRAITFDKMR